MRLPSITSAIKRYPLLPLTLDSNSITYISCMRSLAVMMILPALVCFGALIDGTWRMADNARGLSRHYGFWTQCVTTPIIILLSVVALQTFLKTIGSLERYSVSGEIPRNLRRLISEHVISLCLRRRSRFILYLCMLTGGMWTVVNVAETTDPLKTYGNLIYDSPDHIVGFFATKFFLFFNWTLAYPLALFVVIHITISMISILRHMCQYKILRIDFFHPDNCGGVSIFGNINSIIMAVYFNLFIVIISLLLTHSNRYPTLMLAAITATIVFLLQSFGVVYSIHAFAAMKRKEYLGVINEQLNSQMVTTIHAGRFSADLLSARSHLLSLKTYPYTSQVRLAVNAMRFLPAVVALTKLLQLAKVIPASP